MSIIEMTIFSIALNLDLFIFSFRMGMAISKEKSIPVVSLLLSILQSLVPLIGFYIGFSIGSILGSISTYIGITLLILAGLMLINKSLDNPTVGIYGKSLFLTYLGASFEDLMAGISLGTLNRAIFLFFIIFFIISYIMNCIALKLGKLVKRHINFSLDFVTGMILITIGLINYFEAILK